MPSLNRSELLFGTPSPAARQKRCHSPSPAHLSSRCYEGGHPLLAVFTYPCRPRQCLTVHQDLWASAVATSSLSVYPASLPQVCARWVSGTIVREVGLRLFTHLLATLRHTGKSLTQARTHTHTCMHTHRGSGDPSKACDRRGSDQASLTGATLACELV